MSDCEIVFNSAVLFCTRENMEKAVLQLSQEISALGFPSLYTNGAARLDVVRLINVCWELMQMYRHGRQSREALEEKQLKTGAELDSLKTNVIRLKEDVFTKDRLLAELEEKERQLSLRVQKLTTQLKHEKDEVRRINLALQQHSTQFNHDLKKKEVETNKLKERINKMLSTRSINTSKMGLEVINVVPRTDGTRGKWNTKKTGARYSDDLHHHVTQSYQQQLNELREENHSLRQILHDAYISWVNISDDIKQKNSHDETLAGDVSVEEENINDTPDIEDGLFQLPVEFLQKNVGQTLETLKEKLRHFIEIHGDDSLHGNRSLMEQLLLCEEQIKLKDNLIENLTGGSDAANNSFLRDANFVEEREQLLQEKSRFDKEKETFRKEREIYNDAYVKLVQQKKDLEEEKSEFLRQQLLHEFPSSGLSPPTGRYHSVCPTITPAKDGYVSIRKVARSPTTLELLSDFDLSYNAENSVFAPPKDTRLGFSTLPSRRRQQKPTEGSQRNTSSLERRKNYSKNIGTIKSFSTSDDPRPLVPGGCGRPRTSMGSSTSEKNMGAFSQTLWSTENGTSLDSLWSGPNSISSCSDSVSVRSSEISDRKNSISATVPVVSTSLQPFPSTPTTSGQIRLEFHLTQDGSHDGTVSKSKLAPGISGTVQVRSHPPVTVLPPAAPFVPEVDIVDTPRPSLPPSEHTSPSNSLKNLSGIEGLEELERQMDMCRIHYNS